MHHVLNKGISVFYAMLFLSIPATIRADVSLDLKSQAVSWNSMIDNEGIGVKIGPFLTKRGEFFLHGASESFLHPKNDDIIFSRRNYWFGMVDAIWMNKRMKMVTIGPVLTLEGLWIGEKSYCGYTNGNWMGLLGGIGGRGVLELKNENVIAGRISIAGSIVNNCWFTKDSDSASSGPEVGRNEDYQYSDQYLENLKIMSKKYDRYIFPLYANLDYTKYAQWIFIGAGFNAFWNIEIEKVTKSVGWPGEYSSYLHFGVRLRKKTRQI